MINLLTTDIKQYGNDGTGIAHPIFNQATQNNLSQNITDSDILDNILTEAFTKISWGDLVPELGDINITELFLLVLNLNIRDSIQVSLLEYLAHPDNNLSNYISSLLGQRQDIIVSHTTQTGYNTALQTAFPKAKTDSYPLFTGLLGYMQENKQTLQDRDIYSFLNRAIHLGLSNKVIELLLKLGADVNKIPNNEGNPPLVTAIMQKNLDIVKLLIEHNALVNKQQNGLLPLDVAAIHGTLEIVDLLIAKGAKSSYTDFLSDQRDPYRAAIDILNKYGNQYLGKAHNELTTTSPFEDIKKQYRALCLELHPSTVSNLNNLTKEERETRKEHLKEVTAAYKYINDKKSNDPPSYQYH